MRSRSLLVPVFHLLLASAALAGDFTIDAVQLAGDWRLKLDPRDEGLAAGWTDRRLEDKIVWLPGALQNQGLGDPITTATAWTGSIYDDSYFKEKSYAPYRRPDNIKIPFWLQPRSHYVGPAWYQRTVAIPAAWAGKRIVLSLERPHWGTQVWLDGRPAGEGESLSTPHRFDLTPFARPGTTHTLTLRIDNRLLYPIGVNSHSVSDQTQTNWNGVIGDITLAATEHIWIEDVQVVPDVARKSVRLVVKISADFPVNVSGDMQVSAESCNTPHRHVVPPVEHRFIYLDSSSVPTDMYPGGNVFTIELPMGDDVQMWDEFSPALYRLKVRYAPFETGVSAGEKTVTFGMREIKTAGTQFTINGRPTFLRGTLDCCVFPLTGYPPMDVDAWKRIFRTCKDYGLNHIRFHSWCPPEAAFVAADEIGIYLQAEAASWANQGSSVGRGAPVDDWLYRESERILRAYGNHPSFTMMAYGNEPGGPGRGAAFLGLWLEHFKALDSRRLYVGGAGWPAIPENDFQVLSHPRLHQWRDHLNDRLNSQPPATMDDYTTYVQEFPMPRVSHEIGQWCVFPNFDEMKKYTGALKPKNFEIFQDFLTNHHMADQAHDFLMASGKLQVITYKEEIETALRTPGLGGFQLLGLQDFSGQGTALVGMVDAFWDPKPYVDAAEFRRFCGPTVLLARLDSRTVAEGTPLGFYLQVAHFGPSDLIDATIHWRLIDDDGKVFAEETTTRSTIPTGQLSTIGVASIYFGFISSPTHYRLHAQLGDSDVANEWSIWACPAPPAAADPADIQIATDLDDAAVRKLDSGGKVLLLVAPDRVIAPSVIGFTPVFWNTSWTNNQQPHTLGLLLDPSHALFRDFPTSYHSDWQWWDPVMHSAAMVLDELPPTLRPLIQPIDTWFHSRRLGLAFEARVGDGRLLVCSIDLSTDLENRPVARQLRGSMLGYMNSPAFEPAVPVDPAGIRRLFDRKVFTPRTDRDNIEASAIR